MNNKGYAKDSLQRELHILLAAVKCPGYYKTVHVVTQVLYVVSVLIFLFKLCMTTGKNSN